jgi:transposase InsO family protein
VLRVSKSGYFAWEARKPSNWALRDQHLLKLIQRIHKDSLGTYGAPRVHIALRETYGERVGCKRVARLMRQAGLVGVHRRKTAKNEPRDPGKRLPVFTDLLQRDFSASRPNEKWVADLTQHRTEEGWLYVAGVLDLFGRRLVGWSMASDMSAELVVRAVEMAVTNRRPQPGLIHHSDRGSQYGSRAFGQRLNASGILGSMGSKGDAADPSGSGDNATMESFWATLQTELLDRKTWATKAQLKTAIFHFIEVFYNRKRRHTSLDGMSPADYETRYA